MKCRTQCGACCIYPSISSPIPGMPDGKPAGERCIHLTEELECAIFNNPLRPAVCIGFKPELLFCKNSAEEAREVFEWLMKE